MFSYRNYDYYISLICCHILDTNKAIRQVTICLQSSDTRCGCFSGTSWDSCDNVAVSDF